ncbi:MAG: adenylate/guanylate cyclase domain-containing protein [Actinomycetota bacterium]|nr:adenylate/guanylate cyclase domain-containing protein [Actinomycetota bacterium]
MVVEPVERKLVAIVSADVAGYSRLIAADEVTTVRTLTSYRQAMAELVTQHRGRVVDNPGDNALLEFPSATDAVEAAIDIQELIAERNTDIPADRRMEFRIGVHLGEVMVEGDRIYGEGVNIAARLEAIADVGGICVSKTVHDQVATKVDATFIDLGEQQLKNIPHPIHAYRTEAEGLDPHDPEQAVETNLPGEMSSLIGREEAIEDIARLIEAARLVTLLGSGGVGKTRLGVATARESIGSYPNGVWFIDLARLEDGDLLLPAIADVLDVEPPALRPIEDALVDRIDRGDTLFILDSCEHLIEAAAQAASVLLRRCPSLHVLATSQEALQITGEVVWHVPSLELPDPGAEEDSIAGSAAVDLFCQRAKAVDGSFELTTENAESIASLCRHLGGIPLALELAAARTRTLSVAELDSRLGETFDILTSGGRDVPPRQRTLRATVEWSYELLDEGAKAFFDQLGVFRGTFSLEAAAAVTRETEDGAGDAIDGLVVRSLLQTTPGPSRRFRLLETLRLFALEQLSQSGGLEETRTRHLDWMVTLCLRESPKLMTGGQRDALAELREDVDDIRAALRWALDSGQPRKGLRVATSLARFWYLTSTHKEGAEWLEELMAAGPEVSDLEIGRAKSALAMTLNRIGRINEAAEHARHAVELLEPLGEPQALGWAQFYLAVTTTEPAYTNTERVESLYQASLASFKQAEHPPGIGMATMLLSALSMKRDPERTLEMVGPLLAHAEQTNNANVIAHSLEFIAYANRMLDRTDEVGPAYERAIRLHAEIGNWACLCHAFEGLAAYLIADDLEVEAARVVGGTDAIRGSLSTVQAPFEQVVENDFYRWVDDLDSRADLSQARQEGRGWTRDELVKNAARYASLDD